ncbi:MAG: spore germination protein, partial [Oscillospiraceae bacterium]
MKKINIKNKLNAKLDAIKLAASHKEEKSIPVETQTHLLPNLMQNLITVREKFQNSADFLVREVEIKGVICPFFLFYGLVNLLVFSNIIFDPLLNQTFVKKATANTVYDFIQNKSVIAADQKDIFTYEDVFKFIMSGFVVIFIDGLEKAVALGAQGFSFRSISEPSSEMNERGSREGFTEPLRINMTLVRRRIKSADLMFELMTVGGKSKTDICLMYMNSVVSKKLLREVKRKLKAVELDIILTSGYLQPFLEGKPLSIFSDVGITERPDVLAGKINEGRIAVVVDGTPFALIVPYLFTENFQSLDDYAHRPYYAAFIRFIKYVSFFITILLPGLYVGVAMFHPELLPHALLFNIAASEEVTPFPLYIEAIIIHLLYEIMREAGLRLPRPIGHAVSIVGALVIGDAAVTAGLIGAPMILIVALSAISSFVVPSLSEPNSFLRFSFIILGGTMGLYGITLGCAVMLINIASLTNFSVAFLAPVAPFSLSGMRDTFIRIGFKKMQKRTAKIQN